MGSAGQKVFKPHELVSVMRFGLIAYEMPMRTDEFDASHAPARQSPDANLAFHIGT